MISVIVPTLNEEKFVEKTLLALKDQTVPKHEYEVIVSDSSSSDATVEIAKSIADKVVVCERMSAGYGRNFGAKHAKGSKLAFVDADTIVSPTYVEGVKEALDRGIAATGPVRALEKDSLKLRAFYRWWSFQSRISVLTRKPIFPGFNFAVSKNVFEDVGGFRPEPITNEDIELSFRLAGNGRIVFNSKMLVYTSTRRLREISIPSYIMNAVEFALFNKSRHWKEHRKDYLQ